MIAAAQIPWSTRPGTELVPPWPAPQLSQAEAELCTVAEWAALLDLNRNAVFKRAPKTHAGMKEVNGLLARAYRLDQLPVDYQERLRGVLHRSNCGSFADVLALRAVNAARWTPDFEFGSKTPGAQERALKRREVMRVYFACLTTGSTQKKANERARAQWLISFGEACNEKTIRRWAEKIDECGGIELAPLEAYCDHKDVPHLNARVENRGDVPVELIAEFRARCCQPGMEHMRGAYRSLEMDWLAGREVPGLGSTAPCVSLAAAPFPVPFERLRKFAPSTAARRQATHGKARARREALPHLKTTRTFLYFGEEYVLDDSRADFICVDDNTGHAIELRFYVCMEVASRRIVSWVLRQTTLGGSGALVAKDVDALIARTLLTCGVAAQGMPYATKLRVERGAVACSPARQTLLEGLFPGRLYISRTSMDGGRNHAGDVVQEGSGHWMGKGEIESFMRTLSYFLQHLPGQRGGTYIRQPAQLGLKGRSDAGLLDYHKGGLIHEGVRDAYAQKALELIDPQRLASAPLEKVGNRFRFRSLAFKSWVMDAVREAIAYYNATPDHRREGYAEVEYANPQTGVLERRMESANERALRLFQQTPTEAISEADAAMLLTHASRRVTIGKNGVTLSIAGRKGWHFWSENSIACHEAGRNATSTKDYVALIDEDAFTTWDGVSPLAIYLLSDSVANWKPGMAGRFLEALPLVPPARRDDPEDMAEKLAAIKRQHSRVQAEVVRAVLPTLAREIADRTQDIRDMEGVVSMVREAATPGALSQLAREITEARAAAAAPAPVAPTRAQQQLDARARYAARKAERRSRPSTPITAESES